jgi:hypothetical protein
VTPAEGVVGAVAVAAVSRPVVSRLLRRRAARRRLVQALRSTSEAERLAAVRLLVEQSVGDHARLLWTMVSRGELDGQAQRALAQGVALHSWEPTVNRHMQRLRRWAAEIQPRSGSLELGPRSTLERAENGSGEEAPWAHWKVG